MHTYPASWRMCSLCDDSPLRTTLHHIHKHPRDDVIANLMWLCGDGTTGCHGLVEHRDPETMKKLAAYLRTRADFRGYLAQKFRERGWNIVPIVAVEAWIDDLEVSKLHRPT